MRIIAYIFILCLIFTPLASAEVSVDDLLKSNKLNSSQREAVAKAIQAAEAGQFPTSAGELKQWQELGDAFAITIQKVAHSLNVEVNTFLRSDVGILVASVIIYKMIGKDILRMIIYGITGMVLTIVIFTSLLLFHKGKKVVNKDTGEISYVDRFEWANNEVKTGSFIVHLAVWIIGIGVLVGNVI